MNRRPDLFTSLVRAKQELNGGVLPAMTPIAEELHAIIDPAFAIGMGALAEDTEMGLRCPVRGCGRWFRHLTPHLNAAHSGIGGADGIKHALSIPHNAPLVSQNSRVSANRPPGRRPSERKFSQEESLRGAAHRAASHRTIGARNLRNECEAQLAQRVLAVRDRIGRLPNYSDVLAHDPRLVDAALTVYGGWTTFAAAFGIKLRRRPADPANKEDVLVMLRAWYDEHGSLPDYDTVRRFSMIPAGVTMRALGTISWAVAMRRAATALGIRGGRYGLPERHDEAAD